MRMRPWPSNERSRRTPIEPLFCKSIRTLAARIDVLSSRTKRTTSGNAWKRSSPAMFESKSKSAATLLDEGDFENCLRRYEELATLQTDPSLAAQSRMVVVICR